MAEAPRHVRFGPRERRGLVAGWRASQLAVVVLGLLTAVALARMLPAGIAAVVSPVVAIAAVASASVPLRGRSAEQWAPVLGAFGLRHVKRPQRLRLPSGANRDLLPRQAVARALELRGLRLSTAPVGPRGDVGFLVDARARRVCVAAMVSSPGGVLAPGGADPAAVEAWANLLRSAARAGSPVARLQWTAWCRAGHQAGDLERVVVLSVAVGFGRRRRRGEAVALALRELLGSARLLAEAGVEVGAPLKVADLAATCTLDGSARSYPWPLSVDERWDHAIVDGSCTVVSWVEEWPRVEREAGFLAALLLVAPGSRVAVTFEPVVPAEAARRLEQERTASMADEEIKRRGGFLSTMRRQRELEGALKREAELADGEGLLTFSGFTAATGPDHAAALAVQGRLEEAAARGGMALRVLFGEQAPALATLLPIARGASG